MDQDFTDVNHDGPMMLTLKQYAHKWQVCTNTVRGWMSDGELREGCHYVRKKRVIRFFPWTQLVTKMMDESAEEEKSWRKLTTVDDSAKGKNSRRKPTSNNKGNRRPRL